MILAIDIGNTTVALGGIKDGRVCFVAHVDTLHGGTAADYRPRLEKAFSGAKHQPVRFSGAILSSVVPELTEAVAHCAAAYCDTPPLVVSPELRTGLTMQVAHPERVGKDRIVDAAAAAAFYPLPVVTVDMGTATTFNVIDEQKCFLGGAICPGLSTGLRALNEKCAQLPPVRLGEPKAAIGTDTQGCMLSGAVLGSAALIDGMVDRFEAQLGRPVNLVVTGGLARFVTPYCRRALTYDPQLMLKGLAALYETNKKAPRRHFRRRGGQKPPKKA